MIVVSRCIAEQFTQGQSQSGSRAVRQSGSQQSDDCGQPVYSRVIHTRAVGQSGSRAVGSRAVSSRAVSSRMTVVSRCIAERSTQGQSQSGSQAVRQSAVGCVWL
eukprot:1181418-Prorocentrum_minimum.AAC.3